MVFIDRIDAGRRLSGALRDVVRPDGVIVYGVPRGGIVLAREVAGALGAELDVAVTRKIGAPHNPELAIGAVAEDGVVVLDERLVERLRVAQSYVDAEVARQTEEVHRRLDAYRGGKPGSSPAGRTCVLVDDGIATGATVVAALAALRRRGAARVVLAVPVASEEGLALASKEADDVVCLDAPPGFVAVGQWYERFPQVTDEEVVEALRSR
jgi:predicted phosphoribosyltransferase